MIVSLVAPVLSDADELYAVIAANREHLKNLVWAESATLASTGAYLYLVLGTHEHFDLIKVDGKTVGVITLRECVRDEQHGFEVGYWLAKSARGMGVMTRALKKALVPVRNSPVFARVKLQNDRSYAVLERAGFRTMHIEDGWRHLKTANDKVA